MTEAEIVNRMMAEQWAEQQQASPFGKGLFGMGLAGAKAAPVELVMTKGPDGVYRPKGNG